MTGTLSDVAAVLCPFKQFVWLVLALNVTLLLLSAFSVLAADLPTGSQIVLTLATGLNAVSLSAGVGLLVLCRRHERDE
mgnify:FL=1